VVAGYDLAPIDVHAIMPGGRRPARKARAFLDSLAVFLAERAPPRATPRLSRIPTLGLALRRRRSTAHGTHAEPAFHDGTRKRR
jgi:hypothetical protein